MSPTTPNSSASILNGEAELNTTTGETAAITPAEWTIMIYMSGDNDLSHHCIRALAEIKAMLPPDRRRIRVTAQLDPEDSRCETRRLVIDKESIATSGMAARVSSNGNPGRLDEDKIDLEPGKVKFPRHLMTSAGSQSSTNRYETNMADPKTLFDFISRSKDECPASHYMLILDGHASGVEEGFLLKDSNPTGSMSFSDLKMVLSEVKNTLGMTINVLGLDSCLMNMIEICYELEGLAEIVVGSQGLVPGEGWPYGRIFSELGVLQSQGAIATHQIARLVVQEFINAYLENSIIGGLSVDAGALRVSEVRGVADAVNHLAQLLTERLMSPEKLDLLLNKKLPDSDNEPIDYELRDRLILSHWRAQSFNGELYVDLWDFCDLLKSYYHNQDEVFARCQAVQTAVEQMRLKSCFSGIEYQHARGVSIYFPWAEMLRGYKELDFAKRLLGSSNGITSGWYEFLLAYLHTTRRDTRDGAGFKLLIDRQDPPWKKDPPYHGPGESSRSMRNPPREYPRVSDCIANSQRFHDFLRTFSEQ